jgi:hypothetical protein
MPVQSNKHAGKHMSKKIFLNQYVEMEKRRRGFVEGPK